MSYYRKPNYEDVAIATGQQESGTIALRDYVLVGLIMPSAMTSTTITFKAAKDKNQAAAAFQPVYDSDGNQVSLVVAANRAIGLSGAELDALAPFEAIRLLMGSVESPGITIILVKK